MTAKKPKLLVTKAQLVYLIEGQNDGRAHLPNAPGLGGGEACTLCGYVDVSYTESFGVPDCADCLEIVRYCQEEIKL